MMTRRKDTEANIMSELADGINELPSKLMLIVSTMNESTKEMVGELQALRHEVKQLPIQDSSKDILSELKDLREEVKLLRIEQGTKHAMNKNPFIPPREENHMKIYAESLAKSISESIQNAEQLKRKQTEQRDDAVRRKKEIISEWKNKLNRRKQAYWDHHRAKRTSDAYENLLASEPTKMPRKFLPKCIENEDPEETEIRKRLSIEKFKAEIALLKSRSNRYEKKFLQQDTDMVAYITSTFEENISNILIEEWTKECATEEENSIKIFNRKENWFLNNAFENFRSDKPDEDPSAETDQNLNKDNEQVHETDGNPSKAQVTRKKTPQPGNIHSETTTSVNNTKRNSKKGQNQQTGPGNSILKLGNTNQKNGQRNENWENPVSRIPTDFWSKKSTSITDANKKSVSFERFDIEVINFVKDPMMTTEIPRIPLPNEVVLAPDSQTSDSSTEIPHTGDMGITINDSITNDDLTSNQGNSDNFLYHGQGAMAMAISPSHNH